MKILQVITSMQMGGAEKLIAEIVPRLRQREHEVDVCLFDGRDTPLLQQLRKSGCRVYTFSTKGGSVYNPLHILRLWRLMRHYDIVHTHNTAPQFFAALAAEVLCSVVLITTEHNTSNRRRDWRWYPVWLDRWMYNRYRKVICISDQAEANLLTAMRQLSCDVTTIYNGVDVAAFHTAAPLPSLREGSRRFVAAMVAGFRYQKDQDTLIRAFHHLPKENYELWLVGDGERRPDLEKLVAELNLGGQVRLLGLRTDVPRVLKTADVVVMSSHFEGLSLSNIEGMAAGKPFVASDVDGLREVTHGYGLLFPHGDAEALAATICRLHDDRLLYEETATRCYERARQFDIDRMVEQYNQVYLSL